ncbi:MAG: tail protein X [Candidatus Binataceae bacterium]
MTAGQCILHVTAAGERWDLLAWRYYGDASQYSQIIMANPTVAISPVLDSGLAIVVPVVQEAQIASANLPPWKQAQGPAA